MDDHQRNISVAYTSPHLKKVLRSYQASAPNSLHGPNSSLGGWPSQDGSNSMGLGSSVASPPPIQPPATSSAIATERVISVAVAAAKKHSTQPSTSSSSSSSSSKQGGEGSTKISSEYDPFLAPPPFPIQQPPIFTPPDQSRCDRSDTILEGETISCFIVGGEKRLCLPQILNTVLRDFSLQQINGVCDDLHIFCSRCNPEQLDVLKVTGILPVSAPSCGLITKTDAERLCSALLHSNPPRTPILGPDEKSDPKRPFSFKVYHECFGKCVGICTPDWYGSPFSRCIECSECQGLFPPQKFVCHSHRSKENRTCHWGFDSANWRAYLLLAKGQDVKLQERLDEIKARFDYTHKYKRKQKLSEDYESSSSPAPTLQSVGYSKRPRIEEGLPFAYPGLMPLDAAALAAYWYGSPWARISAFKPWSSALTKDGKPVLVPLPAYLAENMPTSVPVYLSPGPSLMQKQDLERNMPLTPENSKCGGGWCWPDFLGARGVGVRPEGMPPTTEASGKDYRQMVCRPQLPESFAMRFTNQNLG